MQTSRWQVRANEWGTFQEVLNRISLFLIAQLGNDRQWSLLITYFILPGIAHFLCFSRKQPFALRKKKHFIFLSLFIPLGQSVGQLGHVENQGPLGLSWCFLHVSPTTPDCRHPMPTCLAHKYSSVRSILDVKWEWLDKNPQNITKSTKSFQKCFNKFCHLFGGFSGSV